MSFENRLCTDYTTESAVKEKCQKWIDSIEPLTTSVDGFSISDCSTEFVSTAADSDLDLTNDDDNSVDTGKVNLGNELKIMSNTVSHINHTEILQTVLKGNSTQTFENIQVANSNKVHIGNVTYVTGPIHIIHNNGGNMGSIHQIASTSSTATQQHPSRGTNDTNINYDHVEEEERNKDDLFVSNVVKNVDSRVLRIVDRRTWLAQPALEYKTLDTPVPYVIISHTATESAETQAGMVYMVRNIQCFHIESRRWNDIAYNFLIGNDGNVYEGRGWKKVGAHTYGYNERGIGISFVGCFMNELPTKIAFDACKLLIKKGVREGYIQKDYKLIAHCQCSPTESPGRMLFEEIKTWPQWKAEP
ncbi:peptidoglycan-recognition protein LE-like [Sabethes cyaneus]|uniref:peptidoglycan-recognition protein LE-like n=1 Tax=Sabethes cyaneus TaxID=53552 RepID=UPI00237D9098|nr:peptidoglycan-recognition protein LE-like [Sabethes cyaneus]